MRVRRFPRLGWMGFYFCSACGTGRRLYSWLILAMVPLLGQETTALPVVSVWAPGVVRESIAPIRWTTGRRAEVAKVAVRLQVQNGERNSTGALVAMNPSVETASDG